MPKTPDLSETFTTLREVLAAQSDELVVTVDGLGEFRVASATMQADPRQVTELSSLTRAGIESFRDVPLPWAPQERRPPVVARTVPRPRRRA